MTFKVNITDTLFAAWLLIITVVLMVMLFGQHSYSSPTSYRANNGHSSTWTPHVYNGPPQTYHGAYPGSNSSDQSYPSDSSSNSDCVTYDGDYTNDDC